MYMNYRLESNSLRDMEPFLFRREIKNGKKYEIALKAIKSRNYVLIITHDSVFLCKKHKFLREQEQTI